ncbi:MAG: glycosyltransferase family 4 protein [Calditerrivibrio sp.]|nr:glycosyltransferase family 4 protein [Calditerrivibrio sp.]MCA1932546.1 glycosyltransferase family 4 protein [Calditerrivibrio sp.]MCA1980064.1 glycosyltransferase family 4 protein [Calditerrivibrio sp.]
MKLGFEVSSISGGNNTGIARYINNVINKISREKNIDINLLYKISREKGKLYSSEYLKNIKTVSYYNNILPIFKPDLDIIHGLDGYIPNWKRCKKLVTIHDIRVIKFAKDHISSYKYRKRKEDLYRKVFKYVDAIITVSQTTKDDIVEYFNLNPDRVVKVHLGINEKFLSYNERNMNKDSIINKYSIKKPYLLYVGAISKQKNTARLVEAFLTCDFKKDFDLILVGPKSFGYEETLNAIDKYNGTNIIKLLGFVSDDDLITLYANSEGFLFPTIYEGFGFPVLEAMALGIPVLTSNIGAVSEIDGGYGIKVDPYSVHEIRIGIDKLVNFDKKLSDQMVQHAKGFTWDKTIKEYSNIYKRISGYTTLDN